MIFITGDQKKDWIEFFDDEGDKKIGPRIELKLELKDEAGVDVFKILNFEDFLQQAEIYLNINDSDNVLTGIKRSLKENKKIYFSDSLYENNDRETDKSYDTFSGKERVVDMMNLVRDKKLIKTNKNILSGNKMLDKLICSISEIEMIKYESRAEKNKEVTHLLKYFKESNVFSEKINNKLGVLISYCELFQDIDIWYIKHQIKSFKEFNI